MALSAENTARLLAIRQKSIEGTATIDELKEGIAILRQDRVSAQIASSQSKTTRAAAAKPVDTGSILADLKNLGLKLSQGPVA